MRSAAFRTGYVLMGVIACAWPFDVYQHLPFTGVTVVGMAAAALVCAWLLDLAIGRTPRLPFELFWPPAIVAASAAAFQIEDAPHIAGAALLFFATVHFARERAEIERLFRYAAAACFLVALADLASRLLGGGPTSAYALPADPNAVPNAFDAISATSGTLANGSTTLLTGFLLSVAVLEAARSKGKSHIMVAAIGIGVMAAACMLNFASLALHVPMETVPWRETSPAGWLVGGLGAWLLARIGAKVIVERARRPDGSYWLVAAPLLAIAIVACFHSQDVMAWHAWAAGLAAGYVLRDKRPAPASSPAIGPAYAAMALIPVVWLATSYPNPANRYDGRNFGLALQADYDAGDTDRVERRLSYWSESSRHDATVSVWYARLALDERRPEWAAAWISDLTFLQRARNARWPKPSWAETSALVNRLRDQVSALDPGERGLAYERALVASRDAASAHASLRQRIAGTNPVYEEINAEPLQNAALFLVEDERIDSQFHDWSVAELLALFGLTGARIEPAPPDVQRGWLPAVVSVRRDARGISVDVESGVAHERSFSTAPASLGTRPRGWQENAWQTASLPFDASSQVSLFADYDSETPVVTVTFGKYGDAVIRVNEPLPESLPDESAVFVWLP